MILAKVNNWKAVDNLVDIQILPTLEDDLHILSSSCKCVTTVSRDLNGRVIVTHSAFDNREFDELAKEVNR